jgi:LuxR family maltose regulon positive regulatory protein
LAQPSPKLHIPVIPREFLERPRLRRRFDAALSRKVILVSAPAGYGKTVFLGEALANINRPVAWLSLDKRDNYFASFWASLIIALQKVQPGLGEHTLAMLRFRKPSVESALTELVNEISEAVPDLIIVLDDYHEINTQAIHDSLAFLLEYLPPQVRLLISSRVDPPLPLARLRGR